MCKIFFQILPRGKKFLTMVRFVKVVLRLSWSGLIGVFLILHKFFMCILGFAIFLCVFLRFLYDNIISHLMVVWEFFCGLLIGISNRYPSGSRLSTDCYVV